MPKDEADPVDPMEFVGVGLPGTAESDEQMAAAVVEEFLLLGHDRAGLIRLFTEPFYRATHRIYVERGEAFVRGVIDRVLDAWGIEGRGDAGCRPNGPPLNRNDPVTFDV